VRQFSFLSLVVSKAFIEAFLLICLSL